MRLAVERRGSPPLGRIGDGDAHPSSAGSDAAARLAAMATTVCRIEEIARRRKFLPFAPGLHNGLILMYLIVYQMLTQ